MANTTKILHCTCTHEYQNKKYGKGMRVHNYGEKHGGSTPGYKCTVCGSLKGGAIKKG